MSIIELKSPQVYFRVDHGKLIGDGHLFRLKALAAKMKTMGFETLFITRAHEGFNPDKFLPFKLIQLKKYNSNQIYDKPYAAWLGVTEKEDQQECLDLVDQAKRNIWVVDHYGIGVAWEEEMILRGQMVVSVDDLFRAHYSHIILDHNLTADKNKYQNHLPDAVFLMGPKYALLRDDICRAPKYSYNAEKESYLLFLGSVDKELFYKFISALRKFSLEKLILLNPPESFQPEANEEILAFCDDLPKLYEKQKLVFGSCGVAHLERMILGVPTVTCVVVDNQIEVGIKTAELEISHHIGDLRSISTDVLKTKLGEIINSPQDLKSKTDKGKKLIFDNGTELIVREIQNKMKALDII